MTTYPFGIDISKYQFSQDGSQKPNFDLMNATCDFVAVRAGISWGYIDPWFRYSWDHIDKPRLAYHVIYPGESASAQADHFLNIVRPEANDRLVLDMELDHGYSKARITDTLLGCLEAILSNTGRYPVIYSRASWVNQYIDVSRLPVVDWWLAHYLTRLPDPQYTPEKTPPPALPNGVDSWFMHQTAEHGNGSAVGVVSHYVDTNRFNGTQEELRAYFGLTESAPAPAPDPIPPIVETPLYEAVVSTVPPNRLRVRRTPNGELVRWLASGDTVNVFQEQVSWSRIGVGEWSSADWLQKLINRTDLMDVPLYSQRDPRWANDKMGSSGITLGAQGCLVTISSAGLTCLGYPITPKEYNLAASTKGGYQAPNLMYWKFPDVLTKNAIVRDEYQLFNSGKGWETLADRILSDARPVWAQVDFIPGGTMDQHWVLILGKSEGNYWCLDPYYGTIAALAARYNGVFRVVSYRRQA